MRNVSLFQGILLAIFGLGALIGLFVFATYTSGGGSSNVVGKVTLWGTLPKSDMQAALTAAAKTDQSLKGVTYVQKDPATLKDDLTTAIATGSGPDLVLASQEELATLVPFLETIPTSQVSASAFQGAFTDGASVYAAPSGGYYGIPFLIDPLVLFSNDAILASDNIAKPPSNWDALTGLVPTVAVLTPSQQITRALIGMGTYDNVHDALGILSALFLQTNVPIAVRTGGGLLTADLGGTSQGGVPPGQAVLRFYTQFADPAKVSYTWNASLDDSQSVFLAGNLAFYLGYVSEARFMEQANPNLSFSVSPLPQLSTATTKTTYGRIYAFMIPKGATNSAGAYQAAVLMTNTAEQEESASATGLAPASRTVLATPPSSDPIAEVAYASALYTEGWLSPAASATDQVFSGMIDNVITGRTTLATALSIAERSLSSLLQ